MDVPSMAVCLRENMSQLWASDVSVSVSEPSSPPPSLRLLNVCQQQSANLSASERVLHLVLITKPNAQFPIMQPVALQFTVRDILAVLFVPHCFRECECV